MIIAYIIIYIIIAVVVFVIATKFAIARHEHVYSETITMNLFISIFWPMAVPLIVVFKVLEIFYDFMINYINDRI